jgi:UDP-N-acetyl-D-mannosaminuronic acid transferase (WecB/TagA/CpsF family)
MSEIDEVFDEKEKESMMAAIVKLFETKRKEGIKVLNSTKVYKAMKNASSEQLIRSALQELNYRKIIVMETHGKAKKWSLSRLH